MGSCSRAMAENGRMGVWVWHTSPKPNQCFFVVLYLWVSSCGADDGSPTYWLSLDRDHLHSAIPMFGTMLGFSNQTHWTNYFSVLASVLFLECEKRIRVIIVTSPPPSRAVSKHGLKSEKWVCYWRKENWENITSVTHLVDLIICNKAIVNNRNNTFVAPHFGK